MAELKLNRGKNMLDFIQELLSEYWANGLLVSGIPSMKGNILKLSKIIMIRIGLETYTKIGKKN